MGRGGGSCSLGKERENPETSLASLWVALELCWLDRRTHDSKGAKLLSGVGCRNILSVSSCLRCLEVYLHLLLPWVSFPQACELLVDRDLEITLACWLISGVWGCHTGAAQTRTGAAVTCSRKWSMVYRASFRTQRQQSAWVPWVATTRQRDVYLTNQSWMHARDSCRRRILSCITLRIYRKRMAENIWYTIILAFPDLARGLVQRWNEHSEISFRNQSVPSLS